VRRGAAAMALAVLLALGVLGGLQLAYVERILPGVRALGVDLGGRRPAEAEALLAAPAAAVLDEPVVLRAGDTTRATTWRALGLRLAPAELAAEAQALGHRGDPLRRLREQWRAVTGGVELAAAEHFDEPTLAAYLQTLAQAVARPPRDARLLVLPDGTVQYTSAQSGQTLALDAAAAAVRAARRMGQREIDLPLEQVPPATPDALRSEAREFAERVLAGPLVLEYAGRQWSIERPELAEWLVFTGGPAEPLSARLDTDAVRQRLRALAAEIDQPVLDARFDWNGGRPRLLRPSQPGQQLDLSAAVQRVLERATSTERTVPLPVQTLTPAVGDDPAALGPQELIEEASTSFAGAIPEKAHNIRLAAERLHGTVVPPGGRFSFNREVGPTTLEAGFQWGFGITSGDSGGPRTVPSVAGGICQVATTLFQAFFWAGYRLEERHWHLYWIPAYTSRGVVGLDATVDEEAGLDLQFINTTPDPVLIQAAVDGSTVTFRLYGKRPAWTVEVAPPEITNRVPPDLQPVVEEDPSLPAGRRIVVETAREGFDVTVVRRVTEGTDVRTLTLKSSYRPSRNVTLVGTGGAPAPATSAQNRPVGASAHE